MIVLLVGFGLGGGVVGGFGGFVRHGCAEGLNPWLDFRHMTSTS